MISCLGDVHVDALDRIIPEAYKKILSTIDKVVKREIAAGTSAIVQLGDFFDNAYPDQTYTQAVMQVIKENNQVDWHILIGNHDFDDPRNYALRTIRWLFHIGFLKGKVYRKPEVVKIDGDRYLFCSHPHVVDTPPKGTHFCFGHFGYEGARGDNGYVIKSGNTPRGRWILGDYHTMQRGKNYLYPGSICQVKFNESADKYIVRIEDKPQTLKINQDIRLGRTSINSEDDLLALDRDIYWSVNISSKVKLPPDFATRYPHIIKHHADKDSSKKQRVLMAKVTAENPLEGFGAYLIEEGMSKKEAKRTLHLMGIDEHV